MPAAFTLIEKIAPLYALIAAGFTLAKFTPLRKEMLSFPLIYIIAPIVFFNAAFTAELSISTLSLPILFFVVCTLICLGSYRLWRNILVQSDVRGIFAFMNGETNVSFFGIPAAAALYGSAVSTIVTLSTLGFALYESTVGYYIAAKGRGTAQHSLSKLMRLPTVYAFALGFILNAAGLHLHNIGVFDISVSAAKFCLTFVGMTLVGFAAANLRVRDVDMKFLLSGLSVRFIIWPLIAIAVILLDSNLLHLYSPVSYKAILLISSLPTAASAAVFATQLRNNPERVSSVILVSTAVSLVYVPLIAMSLGRIIT